MTEPTPGWYPDPENPQQARWFDGSVWTDQVQPLESAAAGQSPSAPGAPNGSGSNDTTKRVLIIGGAALAVIVTLVGGLLLWKQLNKPEEVSPREFAKQWCEQSAEVTQRSYDAAEALGDASDRLDIDYSGDRPDYSNADEREVTAYRDAINADLDATEALVDEFSSFVAGHRLRGSAGESFAEDLVDWVAERRESLDEARADLAEIDLSDPEDAAEALTDLDVGYPSVRDSDELTEVSSEISEEFEEDKPCSFPSSYGE
jgi:hypothetical protein